MNTTQIATIEILGISQQAQQALQRESYVNPSIGIIGEPYYDKGNDRVKLFSTQLHTDRSTIDSQVSEALIKMNHENASRFTGRFIINNFIDTANMLVEARIPLTGNYSGNDLVYLGRNSHARRDSSAVLSEEDDLLRKIYATKINHTALPEHYSVSKLTLDTLRQGDIKDMVGIYSDAFKTYTAKLNEETITSMITNSEVSVVRYANENGRIVSIAVGEISDVEMPYGIFKVCELSEMATARDHRGRGLNTAAASRLISDLKSRENSPDLIYAEARASHAPINKAFYNLGFMYAGRLGKHCILSGDSDVNESGPFENLNVWYMP